MSRWLITVASVQDERAWIALADTGIDLIGFTSALYKSFLNKPSDVPFVTSVTDGWSMPFAAPAFLPPRAYERDDDEHPFFLLTLRDKTCATARSALKETLDSCPLDGYAISATIQALETAETFSRIMRHGCVIMALERFGSCIDDGDIASGENHG